jgi:hypothetical protein
MNIYIPMSDAKHIVKEMLRPDRVVINPAAPPRKVEVQVSIDSNHSWLKQKDIEHYIFWFLMKNGASLQLEQSLGMTLYSFELLHGKRSSVSTACPVTARKGCSAPAALTRPVLTSGKGSRSASSVAPLTSSPLGSKDLCLGNTGTTATSTGSLQTTL